GGVTWAVGRTGGELAGAVGAARHAGRALLVLVRRAGAAAPLVVAAATWDRAVAVAPAPPPAEAPSVRAVVAAPPPPPLPPEASVTLDEVLRGLGDLDAADRPAARLPAYRRGLALLHRQGETPAARGTAPANVVAGLRTVLGYYDAAAVAWGSAEAQRESVRQPRHVASAETATAPYFGDSDVAAVIDEFPFLRETVVRD